MKIIRTILLFGILFMSLFNNNVEAIDITKIDDLNNIKKPIDSNRSNTANSTLEFNYRENVVLDSSIAINGKTIDGDGISDIDKKAYFSYPRLIKLNHPVDGYKYILTYQSTQNRIAFDYAYNNAIKNDPMHENGIDIYYIRSNDLKTWTEPALLFESNYDDLTRRNTNNLIYLYYSAEILEYNENKDNKLMALTCKYALSHWKYEGYSGFNQQGLYIKTSTDGGATWSDERKIYTGPCWDASAIQLDSGEIQVYMTHIAPIMYVQSSQITGLETKYHAVFSGYHNSSGIAMISSLNYGKDWTPNVTGTTEKYYSLLAKQGDNFRNPYSAYRVAQEWWREKATRKSEPSNEPYNFNDVTTNGSKIYGIELDDDKVYHMVAGMTSPVELNNKKRIVLPSEAGSAVWETPQNSSDCSDEKCLYQTVSVSLYYSDKSDISINGIKKQKYWLDINNKTVNNFSNESDVYDSEGLSLAEEGPINRATHLIERGSGPSLTQFPSGETLLAYHTWPNMFIKMGNSNAEFSGISAGDGVNEANTIEAKCNSGSNDKNKVNSDTICVNGISYWGSVQVVDSHKGVLTKAYKADKNSNVVTTDSSFDHGVISLSPFYLNHTLDIVPKENNEALFIGSDSQAQASIRSWYDLDNIYFRIDVLDNNVTNSDLFELYIHNADLKYDNVNYEYLYINASSNNNSIVKLFNNSSEKNISNIVLIDTAVYNTKDENGGYVINITIPKNAFNLTSNSIKIDAVLNNYDGVGEITYDTFAGVTVDNRLTWLDIKLKGDINGDGIADNADFGQLARYTIKSTNDDRILNYGDMSGDNKIKMNDVMSLISLMK